MLALLGYLMVITFMVLILTKRLSPFTALIIVPVIFGLIGGFGLDLGPLMIEGITKITPTAILLLFAIMYFGIMLDTGLFDPLINKLLSVVKGDPLKVIVASAILPGIVGFDGDGATTIMICVTPFLPLYKKLGINPLILAALTIMQIGITTLVPWGGPAGRVASALHIDITELYIALLPGMIIALVYVVFVAYMIGKRERARLGVSHFHINPDVQDEMASTIEGTDIIEEDLKRPKLLWINLLLTAVIMVAIFGDWVPTPVLFMIGTAVALVINYPALPDQQKRISFHAPNAFAVASMVFAAGIFTGILRGTKMSEEMAQGLVSIIPPEFGAHFPIITAIISAPGMFFLGPDGFLFGILPILAETASSYGISNLEMGIASLFGTPFAIVGPLVASLYLLIGMTGVGLGELQKFVAKRSIMIMVIYIVTGLLIGTISL
ncbi:citrate:proton symporter [Bacillus sp. JJ1521]|uniref:CitMHS family transporter n=1 Tax=Bacillus sp. JJ1521 TaxID=3122957 RepID=UPI00300009C4